MFLLRQWKSITHNQLINLGNLHENMIHLLTRNIISSASPCNSFNEDYYYYYVSSIIIALGPFSATAPESHNQRSHN